MTIMMMITHWSLVHDNNDDDDDMITTKNDNNDDDNTLFSGDDDGKHGGTVVDVSMSNDSRLKKRWTYNGRKQ